MTKEVDYPDDAQEIVGRLFRIFPLTGIMADEGWTPGDYNTRFSNHIGTLDVTYDPEATVNGARVVRATVWNGCDALLAVDVLGAGTIHKVCHWQDAKVREQLIPLVNHKLVLDDLSNV